MTSPEFCDNLLGLADSQHEVVAFAQFGQKVDLHLVVLGNEIHQSCVICKLCHVMGAEGWCVYRSSRFHIVVDYVILQITQKTLLNTGMHFQLEMHTCGKGAIFVWNTVGTCRVVAVGRHTASHLH